MASVVKKHGKTLQLQQQKADRDLSEQSRALATAQKALQDAVAASKQASQVCHCLHFQSCETVDTMTMSCL